MFNVAVIKLKDIIKCLFALIIIMSIIYVINRYFVHKEKKIQINVLQSISCKIKEYNLYPINSAMPIIHTVSNKDEYILRDKENTKNKIDMNEIFTSVIGLEIPIVDVQMNQKKKVLDEEKDEVNKEEKENNSEETKEKKQDKKEEVELAKNTDVKTEVVTQNPIAEKYTDKHDNVKIKNETDFELTDDILNTDSLEIDSSNIIIFHTHTCESYTSSEKYSYNPTGNYRTTDLNYSVAKVGDELTSYLDKYGFNVTHDKTFHDYPAYSGSYNRSYATVSKLLEKQKADIIIDLHRDAIGNYSSYAPTVKIGDDYCAQIMFVMGTNGGGLSHSNWQSNLKFAVKVQEQANKKYPGLFKPIILRNSRYNQNLGKAACIIEVGSTGNTLEQCLNSMKYFSDIMNEVLK